MPLEVDRNLDPPEDLPCRECYDRVHRPKPSMILADALEDMGIEDERFVRSHIASAMYSKWWSGFVGALEAAYEETIPEGDWTLCPRHAAEARAEEREER